MKTYILKLTVAAAMLATMSASSAQIIPHVARAERVCCLPGRYDYGYQKLSNPETAVSYRGTDVTSRIVSDGQFGPGVQIRTFPLRDRALTIQHCRISNVVVTLAETGRWSVDFTAEQNPELVDRMQRPRVMLDQQNRFQITVRPLLGESIITPQGQNAVSIPAAAVLYVQPFWLERGQRVNRKATGMANPDIRQSFDQIQFVAVDLQFE